MAFQVHTVFTFTPSISLTRALMRLWRLITQTQSPSSMPSDAAVRRLT